MCVFGYLHCQGYLFHGFHLLEPLPLRNARGFSLPRNIPTKNFSEIFFKSTQGDFLLIFWREFVMRGMAACPCNRGGYPLFVGLWACCRSASLPSLSLVPFPSFPFLVPSFLVGFRSLLANSIGSTPAPSGRLVLLCSSFCWVVLGFPASVLPRFPRELEDLRT